MLLGACWGGLRAYVQWEGVAWEIDRNVWRGGCVPIADPVTLALSGEFQIVASLLPTSSLVVRLAGKPLYLRNADLKMLLGPSGGSESERLRVARELIQAFRDQNARGWMTIEAYLAAMKARFPGVSGRELARIRKEVWPKEWLEKRGRPRGR
jgi:hypothetical protein